MKIDLQTSKKVRIEMLPLIDIVFLVLVFFIYAMLSMAVHRGLPVVLPISSTSKIDKRLVLNVTVKADGTIFLDKERVDLEELSGLLKSRASGLRQPGVLLFGDRNLSYQQLFKVLDQIRIAGLQRISLQSEVEQ
jgi:biopolymer transport protein ExbD